jgi:hypothetical protein
MIDHFSRLRKIMMMLLFFGKDKVITDEKGR